MSEFQPYFTNDGSVGLYSQEYDDIYHSASGALTEAYEKFILPIDWDNLLQYDNINILDICYGIGYNTKSFLNYIFENKKKLLTRKNFLKKNLSVDDNIEAIHTNNIFPKNDSICNDEIYTDNIFSKISVTAIDNDEILIGLSPFIKTGVRNFKNKSEMLNRHNIYKYLSKNNKNFPKIKNLINYQILSKIAQNRPKILQNPIISTILADKSNDSYFNCNLTGLLNFHYKTYSNGHFIFNLHNIYYRYISKSYKKQLKSNKIQDFDLNIKIDDARNVIKSENTIYNLIFLDAFTPNKCPCLWTYDFFKCLYNILETNGMIFTYSSAAQVRSAMIEAGFEIGNIYNARLNKFQGTIAVKNKSLIKHKLSEADLGLLKTKAGIFYRDKNLTAQNGVIIAAHKIEVENSNRMSSSKYLKSRRTNGL